MVIPVWCVGNLMVVIIGNVICVLLSVVCVGEMVMIGSLVSVNLFLKLFLA